MTDTLPKLVSVGAKHSPLPEWITERGGEVLCFDRGLVGEDGLPAMVGGPSHAFDRTTDIFLDNGLWRFWVGNRLGPPFLNVEAFTEGRWVYSGTLIGEGTLLSARLHRLTPDAGTVVLERRDKGPAYVTLLRGERGVRIVDGDSIAPTETTSRGWRWSGTAPTRELSGVIGRGEGLFDSGLQNDGSGVVSFWWPQDEGVDDWTISTTWLPFAGSADSGPLVEWGDDDWGDGEWGGAGFVDFAHILNLYDSEGIVGHVRFDSSTDRIVFTLGEQTVQSAALSFDGGEAIRVAVRFSTTQGMALSVDGVHVTDTAATDPGTTDDVYYAIGFGPSAVGAAGGVYDQGAISYDYLSDEEVESFTEQTSRSAGLASPEGRLIWFAPFDVDAQTSGSLGGGVASGGLDDFGLTRVLVVLDPATSYGGLGVRASQDVFEVGAFLTTGESFDTPNDIHAQFSAELAQELAVR